jgi:ubinuclein
LSANRRAEGSGIKAKGTRLERAIRDLQNIVSEIECAYLVANLFYARLYTYFEVFLVLTLCVCYFIFFLADRPQTLDVPEIDPNSQAAVKRRLPQEVKQKLARVARLSVMLCHTILYMSAKCF